MFSYLRPHRRTTSTPASSLPDQVHSGEAQPYSATDSTYHGGSRTEDVNISQRVPRATSPLPLLPPIKRVASYGYDQPVNIRYEDTLPEDELRSQQWLPRSSSRVPVPSPQQWAQRQRPESAGNASPIRPTGPTGIQYPRPQTGGGAVQGLKERSGGEQLPFVTAADLQASIVPPGRRPAGIRMATPPPLPQTNISTFEPSQPRSGKTRLNILNPMSLLARRRIMQNPQYPVLTPAVLSLTDSKPLDGFVPGIRGTKVHDFSAPRPKRNVSYNDVQGLRDPNLRPTQYMGSANSQHGESSQRLPDERDPNHRGGGNYTPAFTEDFDEEQYPAAGPNVRKANDFADLQLPKPLFARKVAQSSGQPSSTTANYPEASQLTEGKAELSLWTSLPNVALPILPETISKPPPPSSSSLIEVKSKPDDDIYNPTKASSTERHPRVSQISAKDVAMAHLPKHMKSTSSRFSFDMIGAASQEKMLEDRHRQKALEKKTSSPEPRDEYSNYGEDDFDYENMYDDDGLEELIPGVNADAEDERFEGTVEPSLGGFTFHSMDVSITPSLLSPRSPGTVDTPRDANGEVIGFAITKESPNAPRRQSPLSTASPQSPDESDVLKSNHFKERNGYHGLGLQSVEASQNQENNIKSVNIAQDAPSGFKPPYKPTLDDDDLYFDDGIIDHPSDDEEVPEFDESVFDNDDTDEYGRPLRPLSSLPTLYSPHIKPDNVQTDQERHDTGHGSRMSQELEDPSSALSLRSDSSVFPPTVDRSNSLIHPPQRGNSLTRDSLSAYQSALAAAAYKAAASGRFRRDSSPTMHFDERDEDPSMITDKHEVNSELSMHQPLSPDYEDDFDYDDALEDDPIIAEANAEALANDSDGFYGQEFGFYSAPVAGEAQFGGSFAPRGANGNVSNQNGRIASREPNLTPITERSEYSNRNSIMSLPLSSVSHVVGSGPVNSPGLIQLAGMLNEQDEENMSLESLLKLRRGAWGGSQASLRSSNGNGSPMSAAGEDAGLGQQLIHNSSFGHSRDNSGYSIRSDVAASISETNSAPASPALTMNTLSKSHPQSNNCSTSVIPLLPAPSTALLSSLNSRPMSPTFPKPSSAVGIVSHEAAVDNENNTHTPKAKGNHRHTASSDSISYMKEDDPVAGERWVLERRRTVESGEVEILGREVISGGMI